jgi:hypothetical protein
MAKKQSPLGNIIEIPPIEEEDEYSDEDYDDEDEENLDPEEVARLLERSRSSQPPLSTVPLASTGVSPAEEVKRKQQEQIIIQQQIDALNNKPAPPTPTKAQVNAEAAKEIARNIASQTTDSLHTQLQNQKKMDKVLTEAQQKDGETIGILCHKLNMYRQQYQQKIQFKFKTSYTPSMGLKALQAEIAQVELILNTTDVPNFIKDLAVRVGELIEFVAPHLGFPMNGLAADLKVVADAGYFTEELEQLKIEMSDYFAVSAKQRFAYKYGWIVTSRFMKNVQMPGAGLTTAPSVTVKAVHSDL